MKYFHSIVFEKDEKFLMIAPNSTGEISIIETEHPQEATIFNIGFTEVVQQFLEKSEFEGYSPVVLELFLREPEDTLTKANEVLKRCFGEFKEPQHKWSEHLSSFDPKLITELGKALGYPECCILEFCDSIERTAVKEQQPNKKDKKRLKAAHVDGQFLGFIPCLTHAKKINQGKIKLEDLVDTKQRSNEFPPFPQWDLKQ